MNKREYYYKNQEKIKAYNRARYRKKKKRILAQNKRWRLDNPEKNSLQKRKHMLKSLYALSLAEYNEMSKRQGYRCAICSKKQTGFRPLCVDHNRKTGQVRLLLCDKCNLGIGLFEENIESLKALVKYLVRFSREWDDEDE